MTHGMNGIKTTSKFINRSISIFKRLYIEISAHQDSIHIKTSRQANQIYHSTAPLTTNSISTFSFTKSLLFLELNQIYHDEKITFYTLFYKC